MERAIREGLAEDDRWHIRRDGSRFFATGVMQPIYDEAGHLRGFTKVMRDSTEKRRLEYVRDGQADVLDRLLGILSAQPHREEPLRQVLAMIAELLRADAVCLLLPDPSSVPLKDAWRPEYVHSDPTHAETQKPAANPDVWEPFTRSLRLFQDMTRTRWPVVVEDCAADARIAECPAGVGTLIVAPMLLSGDIIGALCITGSSPRQYLPEEVELAQALAQQAALALQLRRLGEQEQRNAVLAERNRIAGEIHDTLAQSLTGILLQLETAEWEVVQAPEKALARLARSRDLAQQSLTEARRSVWALHPRALEEGSLMEALQRHMRQMEQSAQGAAVEGTLRVVGDPRPLPPDVESNLLRIGMEAITNVFKHAEAERYSVELAFDPEIVRLSVADTGKGFPIIPPRAEATLPELSSSRQGGFGLIAMRDRAERLGGRLFISDRREKGVQVTAVVPTSAKGT
jgi:signal transduction histidine kinase